MYDIIVIGGGPAGMTAALYGLRAGKSVLIIEKESFGGQMTFSPKIENYPGFLSISGNELASQMMDQVTEQGAELAYEEAISLDVSGKLKKVITDGGGEYEARAVIIASGVKHRLLNVPGEEKFLGEGISFCAVCDGAFYQDKDVVVVGGGNSALQEALLLSNTCSSVTVVQNLDSLTGEKRLADLLERETNVNIICGHTVTEIVGEDFITGIKIKSAVNGNVRQIKCDGVFVAVGLVPVNGGFADSVKLDDVGYIVSGEECVTSGEGVFAAGDCRTKKVRQISSAVSDGAAAALAACEYIDKNSI